MIKEYSKNCFITFLGPQYQKVIELPGHRRKCCFGNHDFVKIILISEITKRFLCFIKLSVSVSLLYHIPYKLKKY